MNMNAKLMAEADKQVIRSLVCLYLLARADMLRAKGMGHSPVIHQGVMIGYRQAAKHVAFFAYESARKRMFAERMARLNLNCA